MPLGIEGPGNTHAYNRGIRRLANRAWGKQNINFGKPVVGERSSKTLARIGRRLNARIRAKQIAAAVALAKERAKEDRNNRNRQNATAADQREETVHGNVNLAKA